MQRNKVLQKKNKSIEQKKLRSQNKNKVLRGVTPTGCEGARVNFPAPFLTLDKYSSWRVVLFMMVSGGRAGGCLLKSTIISTVLSIKLQAVKTAPDSQLLNLLSVSRLVTVLNEPNQCSVISKLQKLDRIVSRCAVIGVQGEEQWG